MQLIAFAPADVSSYTIPDILTAIGDSAFKGCQGLRNIIISKNVNLIGENAFHGCIKLDDVIFTSLKPPYCHVFNYCIRDQYSWNIFSSNAPELKIHVPAESLDRYRASHNFYGKCTLARNDD